MVLGRLIRAGSRPVDAASLAAFRILLGVLLCGSTVRFLYRGWVHEYFVEPRCFFHYWGFGWVRTLPAPGMYVLYGTLVACAVAITLGFWFRFACALFALGFGYAHFCDKADYLNHYYLVTLLTGLAAFLPLDRCGSLRVWLRPRERADRVHAWALYLLRFQVVVVYTFGGIGKLGSDWLLHGQPLKMWLAANSELPLLGPYLVAPSAGLVFSWCGALFDLSIVTLLAFRRTRSGAFAVLVVFHGLTSLLFHIGLFPWLMLAAASLFFDSAWPRSVLARVRVRGSRRVLADSPVAEGNRAPNVVAGEPLGRGLLVVLVCYALVQVLLPLRAWLYPGNTLWSEEGFRFSWKVMLIEKSGELDLRVVDQTGQSYLVSPRSYLTAFQARMASTQPDMILELAHWVARDFERRGHAAVRVYADARVSFNGRAPERLIDPNVDLARERDTLEPKRWILPAPSEAPP